MTKIKKLQVQQHNADGSFACSESSTFEIINTVNEIIDHIQPIEAPTEEVKGDIDYDDLTTYIGEILDYHNYEKLNELEEWLTERFIPKPIEQELIPLDVSKEEIWGLIGKILDAHQQSKSHGEIMDKITIVIQKFLSKYGVHKQEEERCVCGDCIEMKNKKKCSCFESIIPTPNPQATSVDVENIINNIECTVHGDCYTIDYKSLKEYLSSLPIVQKKRTEDEVECYRNLDSTEDEVRHTTQFLRAYNLISD